MLYVYNDLVRAADSKLVTALVLLDLSSAFDTVDHSTLLTVLDRRFGVRESAMDWFSSYLSDRTQTFCANGVMSRPIPVTCSVPQGSVLGPVLFISYTDDVASIFDSHQVNHHLYADDKQAYVSVPVNNVSLARQILESCISDITSWCTSRRLQLNAAKTELIWFGSRQMLEKLTDSDLTLDTGTTVIRPVKSVRDLGVHLDSELTMKSHISKVVCSCYHQLRRIRQVRRMVGQDVAQQLVSAFILSRLDYCNSLLSRLPGSTIQPLQRVMNAAARVIMNLSLRDHVKPALKQLHWLPVEQRITYKLCLFMHHIHIGQAPQYLSDCVSTVSAASGRYRLRSTGSAVYVLPRTRTRFEERGFFYSGPAAWNTLPCDLHDITDTSTFRKRLKSVLFDRAYH